MTPQKIANLLQTIYLDGVRQHTFPGASPDAPLASSGRSANERGRGVTVK